MENLDLICLQEKFDLDRASRLTGLSKSWPAQSPYAGWPGMHESVAAFLEAVSAGEPGSNSAHKMVQLNLWLLQLRTQRMSEPGRM